MSLPGSRRVMVLLCAVAMTTPQVLAQDALPQLQIEAPASLAPVAEQVRRFDMTRLGGVMRITGLADPGPPIRVILLEEASAAARDTPSWIAGFADVDRDLVVLFPSRIGSYPYGSLETVLHHEIAHVLTARAAGFGQLPRWFSEGLASAAEPTWNLGSRSRFVWEMLAGRALTATELEGLFAQGPRDIARAYVLSERLVRDLLDAFGPGATARILSAVAQGAPFEVALHATTGSSVDMVITAFWRRHTAWESWLGVAGHPFTLWGLITSLALVAIWRHRRRRALRRQLWELEEAAEEQDWEEHRRRYHIH